MRPSAIPVIGAVAFSLALAASADARARFGPVTALRAVVGSVGATLAGARHSRHSYARRHHRGRPADTSDERDAETAAVVAPQPATVARLNTNAPTDRKVFWPYASDDLLEYAFFPKSKDERFWTYGFDAILNSAFVGADGQTRRGRRTDVATADAATPSSSGDPCGSGRAADSADGMIERIAQAIQPGASQRDVLEELRTALAKAIERIKAACPATEPAMPAERLQAIQGRIWAMRDALLTIRLPFERLYGSLTDDQLWHLASADPDTTDGLATTGSTSSSSGTLTCGEQAEGTDWRLRAIERAIRPTDEQRAMLQRMQMGLAGMAQLIGSTCPDYPLLGAMGRFAAASDRLEVMLFAVMTLNPGLPEFYASLSDKQKAGLSRAIRQFRRTSF